MLRKISSSILAFMLTLSLFGTPTLAEEQLPNSGGQGGSGGSAPTSVKEQTVTEPTQDEPAVIESETVEEPNTTENTPQHKIEQGPGKGGVAPVKTEVIKVGDETDKTQDPAPNSDPIPIEPNPETTPEPEIIEPKNLEAVPTTSTIIINGESVSFEAYLINGNNYFKLRDLAYVLSKEKTVGAESSITAEIIKDITTVQFTTYLVNDNIYFKLRDLGAAFDFGVDWDGENNTVIIDTTKGYTTD